MAYTKKNKYCLHNIGVIFFLLFCTHFPVHSVTVSTLPEIVQYGRSSSFVFLLLPKDLTIIFICNLMHTKKAIYEILLLLPKHYTIMTKNLLNSLN